LVLNDVARGISIGESPAGIGAEVCYAAANTDHYQTTA
jgi:hypothetical protein